MTFHNKFQLVLSCLVLLIAQTSILLKSSRSDRRGFVAQVCMHFVFLLDTNDNGEVLFGTQAD